ncbi:Uncharacterised protein [Legionella beliardensis]|uniref:Uncharacterized protein n=1 Tax=Legionella beliardensis TaxID=91822 RepID=A0A378HYC2_9GAMM|nr:hypothetical protein [Legionella beliardensis]STX27897.1 Uncharacterised protein [Legionella beliardensis]
MVNKFKDEIDLVLSQIQKLVSSTDNQAVKKLYLYQSLLNDNRFTTAHTSDCQTNLNDAKELLNNLLLAKQAVEHVRASMTSAHSKNFSELAAIRDKLNNKELRATFGALKNQREKLSLFDKSLAAFDQEAYRKGTGFNMTMWYRHMNSPKSRKVLGNCTEQSNAAFVYLYTHFREQFSNSSPSSLQSLHRIDISNTIGGHSYTLINGIAGADINPQSKCTMSKFLSEIENFSNTAVVVDPWNSEAPFYPAADIPNKMPACGLKGEVNIEFGLSLSEHEANNTGYKL